MDSELLNLINIDLKIDRFNEMRLVKPHLKLKKTRFIFINN